MKNIFKILMLFALSSLFIVTSCNKDDDDNNENEHAKLTVEEHKANLETTGDEMIEHMTLMKDSKTIDAADAVVNIIDTYGEPDLNLKKGQVAIDLIYAISTINDDDFEIRPFLKSLSKVEETRFDFNANKGKYTWNSTTNTWDKTMSDNIVFEFPSTEGGSNDALLTFYNTYTDKQITVDYEVVYLPTNIKIDLVIAGTKEMEFTFTADFKADGVPTSYNASLFINPFTFTSSGSNSDTQVTASESIKYNEETIFEVSGTVKGSFSTTDVEPEVDEASGYVRYLDFKVEGTANVDALEATEPNTTADDINTYIDLGLYYVSDGYKIADFEFYEKGEEEPGLRLIFADNSTVDAEVYFENIIADMESFFESLENEFDVK